MKFEKIKYFAATVTIDFLSYLLSMENLITASCMFNVRIGSNTPIVVLKRSYVPYSVVDKILVYNGTKKKLSNLVAKLLRVKRPMFFNKYLYLFTNYSPCPISLYIINIALIIRTV